MSETRFCGHSNQLNQFVLRFFYQLTENRLFFKSRRIFLNQLSIFILFIVSIHHFEDCGASELRIEANRINFIMTIIIIDEYSSQKKLSQNKRMIRNIHDKNVMINAEFFDFHFHMKTNIDQIKIMIDLKIDQNSRKQRMHN